MQMLRGSAQRWTSAGLGALLLMLILPLIVGCGLSGPAAGAGQTGTPTASAATTATITLTPTPRTVTLLLGQTHASVTDTLTVTVANNLPAAIQVEDHQSDCTIVTLERQQGSGWLAVASCQLETPTRLLSIPAGATQTVTLKPAGGPQSGTWQAGTYRFGLRYSTAEGQASPAAFAPTGIVYSPTVTIA